MSEHDTTRITAYVSEGLLKKIKILCVQRGISMSTLIERLLQRELKEEKTTL